MNETWASLGLDFATFFNVLICFSLVNCSNFFFFLPPSKSGVDKMIDKPRLYPFLKPYSCMVGQLTQSGRDVCECVFACARVQSPRFLSFKEFCTYSLGTSRCRGLFLQLVKEAIFNVDV